MDRVGCDTFFSITPRMSATERQENLTHAETMEKATDTETTGAAQSLPHSDLLDEFPGATQAMSGSPMIRQNLKFTSGTPCVNQVGLDGMTTVYVYKDGSHELGECSRDGEVFCAFQLGAYFPSNAEVSHGAERRCDH